MWFSQVAKRFRCIGLGLALLAPMGLRAQLLQGTLDGNITDASQAAMVGATVVATDPATGFSRSGTTNTGGFYTLSGLPPGTYNVNVSAAAFQPSTHTGVPITAQTVSRLDVTLNIGSVNETVTVSAQAAELQADRADVHTELGANVLENVPVPIGRNYQMVFTTIPGVSPPHQRKPRRQPQLPSDGAIYLGRARRYVQFREYAASRAGQHIHQLKHFHAGCWHSEYRRGWYRAARPAALHAPGLVREPTASMRRI